MDITIKTNCDESVRRAHITLSNGAMLTIREEFPGELSISNGEGKIYIEGNSTNYFILHCDNEFGDIAKRIDSSRRDAL